MRPDGDIRITTDDASSTTNQLTWLDREGSSCTRIMPVFSMAHAVHPCHTEERREGREGKGRLAVIPAPFLHTSASISLWLSHSGAQANF